MFIALALIAIAGGALVTYLFDEDAPLVARLCMGAGLGFAALGLFGFILASIFSLSYPVLIFSTILLASPLLILVKPLRRAQVNEDIREAVRGARRAILHPTRRTNVYIIFSALVVLLLWLVFDRAMIELPDGIYTGVKNNYGDLPFHLSIITSFSDGANFPPEDPTWAGARFTYPFMVDFVAACFVRAGASLRQAMLLENFVLALSLVGLLYRFTLKLTREWIAGLIAPALVLFSGGLGWWYFFKDSKWSEQGVFGVLFNLQQQFTITMNSVPDTGFRWGNSLTTLLVPQRGILFGLLLALIVFTIWWQVTHEDMDALTRGRGDAAKGNEDKKRRKRGGKGMRKGIENPRVNASTRQRIPAMQRMAAAGAIAGVLPLVHAHSFVVVMLVGAGVALLTGIKEWRAWAAFFIVAGLIAAPQMWWATHGSSVQAESFFGWNFGWDKGNENFFWFWFKNTGLFIPLIFAAFLWRGDHSDGEKYLASRRLFYFYLPFTLCFIVPNLIKLAPWPWDNIKVIFYWFIASVPLVALLLARLLRGSFTLRAVSVALFLTLTLAGVLDVWGVASRVSEFRIFDAGGVAFAEVVKEKTPPRATILHAPTFNTPVFLTGRRSVMGYPGHIGSHGIDYKDRLREIMRIYAGAPDAESLLAKYGVEYVVVGPHERHEMEQQRMFLNDQFFMRYSLAGETGEYSLYKIARP
ncbi:MAG TPA: hypothetical protein VGN95_23180 [Pyrinomonadaceae bacterium]|jgi:hypothetical protein|nr:hypothetical protein [Pyrinomonadaceae bacterium]